MLWLLNFYGNIGNVVKIINGFIRWLIVLFFSKIYPKSLIISLKNLKFTCFYVQYVLTYLIKINIFCNVIISFHFICLKILGWGDIDNEPKIIITKIIQINTIRIMQKNNEKVINLFDYSKF